MSKLIKNWLPPLIWAGLIFFLSHQPDLKSDLSFSWDLILRKLAHLTEYLVLTLLLVRAFAQSFTQYQISFPKILFWAGILSLGYAFSDEYHQTFILGREGSLRDVGVDTLGILLAIFFLWKRQRASENKKVSS